jgi:hypothetical protein
MSDQDDRKALLANLRQAAGAVREKSNESRSKWVKAVWYLSARLATFQAPKDGHSGARIDWLRLADAVKDLEKPGIVNGLINDLKGPESTSGSTWSVNRLTGKFAIHNPELVAYQRAGPTSRAEGGKREG